MSFKYTSSIHNCTKMNINSSNTNTGGLLSLENSPITAINLKSHISFIFGQKQTELRGEFEGKHKNTIMGWLKWAHWPERPVQIGIKMIFRALCLSSLIYCQIILFLTPAWHSDKVDINVKLYLNSRVSFKGTKSLSQLNF